MVVDAAPIKNPSRVFNEISGFLSVTPIKKSAQCL